MEKVLRALAEPHRRQILGLVGGRELAAGSIAERFDITRPAVSQHLAVLRRAGLLTERRDGTRRLYRADPGSVRGLRVYLDDLSTPRLAGWGAASGGAEGRGVTRERFSVERELLLRSSPAGVWELVADPEEVTRWMGEAARFDPGVGGRYRVEVLPGLVAAGEFLEVDPPHRLVHTWGWELDHGGPVPPGSTVVVFELRGVLEGTLLRVSHRDLPDLATAGSHSRGWAHYLSRLAALASGHAPGPDPWVTDPDRMLRELRPASGRPSTSRAESGEDG